MSVKKALPSVMMMLVVLTLLEVTTVHVTQDMRVMDLKGTVTVSATFL